MRLTKPTIAVVGSRGIPARYGGAETFVYELAKRLKDVFDVYVTCETNRFKVDAFEGIQRVHILAYHTPTVTIPAIYDIITTLYLLKIKRDIRLIYYVTPDGAIASILARLARKKVVVSTDGIEWKRLLKRMEFVPWRHKLIYFTTAVLMFISEFLSCKIPHITIADSVAIRKYLEQRWRPKRVEYIAYGVRYLPNVDERKQKEILQRLGLRQYEYFLTIGRIVAENNIHLEIEAIKKSKLDVKLVIVGPIDSRDPYVKHLFKLRDGDKRVIFTGTIYDQETIYTLRKNCYAYIHAYTVGGTSPSLLEQLQFNRPIITYDVPFNREVLGKRGIYFRTTEDLKEILKQIWTNKDELAECIMPLVREGFNFNDAYRWQAKRIQQEYSWDKVARKYASLFMKLILLNEQI
jgi:glycosyltransferase involved in cell wall biosynthesis